MSSAQWPGHVVRQEGSEPELIKGMPIWSMALWKFEGCLKVGHLNAHQKNSLPGLEGNRNQQADIPTRSLEMASWVHETNGYVGTAAEQIWAKSKHIPLATSETQKNNKIFLSDNKTGRDCLQEGPEHSWQVKLMLGALGAYKLVLTGIDTDSLLGFAYPMVDANAQRIMEKNKNTTEAIVPIWMVNFHFFS